MHQKRERGVVRNPKVCTKNGPNQMFFLLGAYTSQFLERHTPPPPPAPLLSPPHTPLHPNSFSRVQLSSWCT